MEKKSPLNYFESLPQDRKVALQTLRKLIFEVAPDVQETMRYNMPTYEKSDVFVAMASQKHYLSLYLDVNLVTKYQDELSHLNCGKSCVRFKRLEDLPLGTIKIMLAESLLTK